MKLYVDCSQKVSWNISFRKKRTFNNWFLARWKILFEFCQESKKAARSENLDKRHISFYLDGVITFHKFNPYDEARTPQSTDDRLKYRSKGKNPWLCQGSVLRICGEISADFVRQHFKNAFSKSSNSTVKHFLQDRDPSQNGKKSKNAINEVGNFSISRSPDLNPIENVFKNVKTQLRIDALAIIC